MYWCSHSICSAFTLEASSEAWVLLTLTSRVTYTHVFRIPFSCRYCNGHVHDGDIFILGELSYWRVGRDQHSHHPLQGSALMLSIRSLAAKRFQLSVIAPEVPDIAQPYDQAVSDLPSSSPTVGNPLAMSSLHQEPSTAGNSEYVEETVGSTRQRCTCEEGDRCRVHGGPDVGQNVGSEASNVQVPSEISVKTTTSSWARFGRPKLARVPWLDDWNAHS